MICKKNDIPIFTCDKTAKYINEFLKTNGTSGELVSIKYDKPFNINDLNITAFETSHDAIEPCGFKIDCDSSTLSFATDLGFVSEKNLEYMKDSNFVVLEANYDLSMLDYGSYPYKIKRRIKSNLGHLSNDDTANIILSLMKSNDNMKFLLAHLSEKNNMADLVEQTISTTIQQDGLDLNDSILNIATKTLSSEVYSIC